MAFQIAGLLLILLYRCGTLAASSGTLGFFLDEICEQASIINPTVSLPIDTCLVTPGAEGIAIISSPSCSSGDTATPIMYRDTSCANAEDMDIDFQSSNCYFNGPSGVKAFMFTCPRVAGGSVATSTSTASAGSSSMPVAADSPTVASNAASPRQTTPTHNGAVATASSSTPSTTSQTGTQPTTNSGDSGNGSGNNGSGLSKTQQIAIGVACPLAAILVALLAWWFPCGGRHRH